MGQGRGWDEDMEKREKNGGGDGSRNGSRIVSRDENNMYTTHTYTYVYTSTSFLSPQTKKKTHLFDQVLTRNEPILLKRPRFLTGDAYTGRFV